MNEEKYKIVLVFTKDGVETVYRDHEAVEKFKSLNPTYIMRDAMLGGISVKCDGGAYTFREEPALTHPND